MQDFQDVFISYGRRDSKTFAVELNRRLVDRGLTVWFDFDDIPLGVDYQKQIDDGIEKADNFLFLISPHSVNSDYCKLEIELALKRNKRIIPLMHVEQISRETWQERNPNGTEEEWRIYQAKGLHDHYQNMHPAIRKINWVYVREGVDDFEDAFNKLLAIFDRDKDYVHQHTLLLARALEWEKQQKRSPYLLVGEEQQEAEEWLKTRFKDGQPPCIPTDLHCEFITESRKNADNLMTNVFLSYAQENRTTAEQIRNSLWRAGFTVWINTTDIRAGADFKQAIDRGIEEADNVVYLLSPAAVQSSSCQHELDYALSLHKRIIPLLVEAVASDRIPLKLQDSHHIDLTDNILEVNYQQDESQLLRILRQDAAYQETHKILLTKALKWERQRHNPAILLRSYNLHQAEAWLKIAKQNPFYPPLPLQEYFIAESLRQPPDIPLDVFISYFRADSSFAHKLNDELQAHGKRTWFDQESIAANTTDFQQEIRRAIESADTFLFIPSPRSVASPDNIDEVQYALTLNKRVVTLLHQPIDLSTLPPDLAGVQQFDFNQHQGDFSANFTELLHLLDTDVEHLRSHTRLLQKAREWDETGRNDDLLLRGIELDAAEQWLTDATRKNPEPTDRQRDYIRISRLLETARQKAQIKLQRFALGGVSLALVTAIGLGLTAFQQWKRAEIVTEGQINALARYANALFDKNQDFNALLESIRAARQLKTQIDRVSPETRQRVTETLQKAFYRVTETHRLKGNDAAAIGINFSPDGKTIAAAKADGAIELWDTSGQLLGSFKAHESRVNSVSFSPDGQILASAGLDETVKLWSRSGQLLHTLEGHTRPVRRVSFSADGQTIASASDDKTVRLWNRDGQLLKVLQGHTAAVRTVTFSPDGQTIISGGGAEDTTVRLWNRNGTLLKTLTDHLDDVTDVKVSPDGQTIASASEDESIRLWSRTGKFLRMLTGHNDGVLRINFSPDGKTLVSGGYDNKIKLWDMSGQKVEATRTIEGHEDLVADVSFSPDGTTIASASFDTTIRLWDLFNPILHVLRNHRDGANAVSYSPNGQLLASAGEDGRVNLYSAKGDRLRGFQAHDDRITSLRFSPDSQILATSSTDGSIKLWMLSGQLVTTLKGHGQAVTSLRFSSDGQTIASSSEDGTVKLWNRSGQVLQTLQGHTQGVIDVNFSPDGKTIASSSKDTTVKLWNLSGKLLQTLKGHQSSVNSAIFSPDGQTIITAGNDKTIRFWNQTGTLLKTVRGHREAVTNISFSPDGKLLASVSNDKTINLWSPSGELLHTLTGHDDWVNALSFSPDGKTLASASDDSTVIIWSLLSNKIDDQRVQSLPLDNVLAKSCGWVKDYLKRSPTLDKSDRALCDGVQPLEK
jgi:WD40 repeat protein